MIEYIEDKAAEGERYYASVSREDAWEVSWSAYGKTREEARAILRDKIRSEIAELTAMLNEIP